MGSALMTTRAHQTLGRVAFVGSGPGDAGLLTVRAKELLTRAQLVVTDPDVPADIFTGVGVEVRAAVGEVAVDFAVTEHADRHRHLTRQLAVELQEREFLVSHLQVAAEERSACWTRIDADERG